METQKSTRQTNCAAREAEPEVNLSSNFEGKDTSPRMENVVDVDFVTKNTSATEGSADTRTASRQDQVGDLPIADEALGSETYGIDGDLQDSGFVAFDEHKLAPKKETITLSSQEVLKIAGLGTSALAAGENLQQLLWMSFNSDKLVTTDQQILEGKRWLSTLRKQVRAAWNFMNDQEKWRPEMVVENSLPKLPMEKLVEVMLLFVFCAVMLAFGFYNTAQLLVASGNPKFPEFWDAAPLASATVLFSIGLKGVFQLLTEGPAQRQWTRVLYWVGLPLAGIWLLLFILQFGASISDSGEAFNIEAEINVFDEMPLLTGLKLKIVNVGCQAAQIGAEAFLSAALYCTAKLMIPAKSFTSKIIISPTYLAAEKEHRRLLKKLQYWTGEFTKYMANREKLECQLKASKETIRQKIKAVQNLAA